MSSIAEGQYRSKFAGEDLSDSQYMFVTLESDQTIDLADGITDKAYGVLQNAPESGGEAIVKAMGETKIVAGGALALDVIVAPKADGKAQEATLTQFPRGRVVVAAGAENDLAVIQLFDGSEELGGADEFASLTVTDIITIASAALTLEDSVDIVVNTTTGTKIGTAAGQKLGFWGTTPVIQPSHIADPAAASAITVVVGTGADATTPSGAEFDKARTDLANIKTNLDELNASIDSILAVQASIGITANA